MIRIENYSPGRPNPNTVAVCMPGLKVFFSYMKVIAFRYDGELVCNEEWYSATSAKHLGILKRKYLSKRYFTLKEDFTNELSKAIEESSKRWYTPSRREDGRG